jgi:uncharacterized delta-60 repeat protein
MAKSLSAAEPGPSRVLFFAVVVRYNTNGSLDTSFGTNGIVETQNADACSAIALQTDGDIVLAGPNGIGFTAERYLSNGTLDPTFGTGGIETVDFVSGGTAGGLAVQPNGNILFASGTQLLVLSPTGQPALFRILGATSLALLPNGKILVAEAGGSVAQYTSNFTLDPDFGINGQFGTTGPANGMVVLADGKFLIGGSLNIGLSQIPPSPTGFAVSRYRSTGATDATFGTHGGVVTAVPNYPIVQTVSLGVQSSGDIVELANAISSTSTAAFALARYTPNGQLDPTFGANGIVTTSFPGTTYIAATAIAIQANGDIVAVGNFQTAQPSGFLLARYLGQ